MKKIYTLIAAIAVTCTVNAQTRVATAPVHVSKAGLPSLTSGDRTVTDTLVGYSFTTTTYSLATYGVTGNAGYVCGNNGYGDKQKAQVFTNTIGSIAVDGALIWFGAKQHDGTATVSKVQVKECSVDGAGTTSVGGVSTPVTTGAPGTVHATADLLFAAIDTGSTFAAGTNTVMFTTPVATSGDFAISVDFTALGAGDTVGMVSSTQPAAGPPGDANGTQQAWEQWSTNAWHTLLDAWPLDIDLFVWALVDNNPSGVQELGYINGVRLSQNQPNPANGNTVINYELQNSTDNVSVMIFDVTGKLIRTYSEGSRSAGKYAINVDASNLDAGVYYYALTAGKGRIAKKMIVSK